MIKKLSPESHARKIEHYHRSIKRGHAISSVFKFAIENHLQHPVRVVLCPTWRILSEALLNIYPTNDGSKQRRQPLNPLRFSTNDFFIIMPTTYKPDINGFINYATIQLLPVQGDSGVDTMNDRLTLY